MSGQYLNISFLNFFSNPSVTLKLKFFIFSVSGPKIVSLLKFNVECIPSPNLFGKG